MPSDREIRDRRHEAIREILLTEDPVEQQRDLVDRLRARGFAATQSNVSRDLRDIGAVRVEGHYRIPSWLDDADSPFRRVVHLIRRVKPAGPYQTLLVTERGAGALVAQAIEDDDWEDSWACCPGTARCSCSPSTSSSRSSSTSASSTT